MLASNLGNATMPGEGSPHQIREALHWQDLGQASAVVQKPRASQQKPQRRTMARPCHLVQDILDAGVSPNAPECESPRRVGLPRPRWAALDASAARRRARPVRFTGPGASAAASQGAPPRLRAPPGPPLHGPARRPLSRLRLPGDAHEDPGHTSGLGTNRHSLDRAWTLQLGARRSSARVTAPDSAARLDGPAAANPAAPKPHPHRPGGHLRAHPFSKAEDGD